MGADSYNFTINNNSGDNLFAFVYSFNTVKAGKLALNQALIKPQLLLGPIPLAHGSNTIATPTQVKDSSGTAWAYQKGMRIYVTNSEGANGANKLEALFSGGLGTTPAFAVQPPPNPFGTPWNQYPWTTFEYTIIPGSANGGPGPSVADQLTFDTTTIDEWSYPLTIGYSDTGNSERTFGFSSLDLVKQWLASVPFLSGPDSRGAAVGDPSNLIWRSGLTAVGRKGKVDGNRILGPLKLWQQGSPVPSGNDPNLKPLIPLYAQKRFNGFLATLPPNGPQLSKANAGGKAHHGNLSIWNYGLPKAAPGSSASLGYPAPNGYTLALQKAADAVGGRGLQPNGSQSNWQGFFTYPQENIYAQTTVPVTSSVELNVYGLSSPLALTGSGGVDAITGTSQNETITGGLGADRLTGGGGSDRYLYLTPASSLPGRGDFDTITDFNPKNDRIDLTQIATDSGIAIKYDGGSFSGAKGSLIFVPGPGPGGVGGVLSLDVTGDRRADFSILLSGIARLPASAGWLVA